MDPTWFAGRLRELREKAGLTQRDLSEAAGLSEKAIAQWERGIREPGWSSVLAICQALGVECTTFTQEPTGRPAAKPGRPRKAEEPAVEEPNAEEKSKKRGRKKGG